MQLSPPTIQHQMSELKKHMFTLHNVHAITESRLLFVTVVQAPFYTLLFYSQWIKSNFAYVAKP